MKEPIIQIKAVDEEAYTVLDIIIWIEHAPTKTVSAKKTNQFRLSVGSWLPSGYNFWGQKYHSFEPS